MKIIADDRYIARRKRIGDFGILGGFAVLGIAAILTFVIAPTLPAIQYLVFGAAGVGIVLFFAGSYYGDRFTGPLAHHLVIPKALKGLDRRYVLFQHTLSVPSVLLGPDGLTVIVVRSQAGEVTYTDGKWHHRQKAKFWREFGGQERVGQPQMELGYRIERIHRHLKKNLDGQDVPVRGIVVFVHPDIQLNLEDDPPVPTLKLRELKAWLRGPGAGKFLPPEQQKQIANGLLEPFLENGGQVPEKKTG